MRVPAELLPQACGNFNEALQLKRNQILPTRSSDGVSVSAPGVHFAGPRVPRDVLSNLDLAQQLARVTAHAVAVDFAKLDFVFRIHDEGTT